MPEIPKLDRNDVTLELAGGRRVGMAIYGAANGLPVLALHGTPASRFMFDVADEAAVKLGVTLYCPERPGYGLSEPVDDRNGPDRLSARVDELVEVVNLLGLERFAVIAISGGAPYAVALACRLGERVRALALVSPMGPIYDLPDGVFLGLWRRHKFLFMRAVKAPRALWAGAGIVAGLFKLAPGLFSKVFAKSLGPADHGVLSKEFAHNSLIRMTREALRHGSSGAVGDLHVFSKPWGVDFKSLRARSILWFGTADRLVPVAASRWLGEQLPGCRIVKLEGAGHFWVYENIEDVLASLVDLANEEG